MFSFLSSGSWRSEQSDSWVKTGYIMQRSWKHYSAKERNVFEKMRVVRVGMLAGEAPVKSAFLLSL